MTKRVRHPMQPMYVDEQKVLRFKRNKIIDWLFNTGKLDLNTIGATDFPKEDRQQLAQLLGYSLNGYGELSYVTDKAYDRARKQAEKAGAD